MFEVNNVQNPVSFYLIMVGSELGSQFMILNKKGRLQLWPWLFVITGYKRD